MKQETVKKLLLMAIALFIGIGSPQVANAQNETNKRIAQLQAKYTKKYGASSSNNLSKKGIITKGMSLAFIREYVNDFNQFGFWTHLTLREYQPTVRDMMQFGRTVKSYRINGVWAFLTLNGKVVSSTCLLDSDFYDSCYLISMDYNKEP